MKTLLLLCAGEWAEDLKHGWGTYTYINGDTYEGDWNNNLRHGQGTYTYITSNTQVSAQERTSSSLFEHNYR